MARHAGAQIPLVLTITAPIKQVRLRLAVWKCPWMINPIGSRRLRECCCLTLEATEATELSPPGLSDVGNSPGHRGAISDEPLCEE
jgi:hypothetical protein